MADNFADVLISNCVINLSPDKAQVFRETYRALKPGGRLMISDIVLLAELPELIQQSIDAYVRCLAGALLKEDYLGKIAAAGFENVEVVDETIFAIDLLLSDVNAPVLTSLRQMSRAEIQKLSHTIRSVKVAALKPLTNIPLN